MEKVYTLINWQNAPDTSTPLGKMNLRKMDYAINVHDDRIIAMDITKADQSTINNVIKEITYEESTGVLTVTKVNNTSTTIDTKLEKIAVNFSYNPTTQQLIITLDDNTKQYVDLSALITQYEFLDTDTVSFLVQSDGKIKANIISGSITSDKLQPNFLADIIVQANIAITNANLSKRYAVGGVVPEDSEDNARYYSERSANYAIIAQEYSSIIYPTLHIDMNTGELVSVGGENINFTIDSAGNLISEVTV